MIPDWLQVVSIAAGSAASVAVLGLLVLRAVRRRSLVLSLTVVAVVSVGSVLAGAMGSARAMFLSGHDFGVLLLVCAPAGLVGTATAVLLGRSVVATSRETEQAAEALRAAHARERTLEASRRELVAWVSHDLRTPLAGIRAMAEALEDGVVTDPEVVDRYHRGLRREADRMAAMVDDLFELSRINAAALNLTLQQVSLADVVSDAVASAAPVAEAKGVRLVGGSPGGPAVVEGSLPELGRVLHNLLSNAIRHTPADGVVSVQVGQDADSAFVEVVDACGGIPVEDLPRVFDVAFRGTAARTPDGDGGAGLGLAIAKGLVHAHRGEISIDNHADGCRVVVRLPAQA